MTNFEAASMTEQIISIVCLLICVVGMFFFIKEILIPYFDTAFKEDDCQHNYKYYRTAIGPTLHQ